MGMPTHDPKKSLLGLLYNVAVDKSDPADATGLKSRFHANPDDVAKNDFGITDQIVIRAIVAWGNSRRADNGTREAATTTLMTLLGLEILTGDATGEPYKIW
jgi:hypothetical protein